MSQSVLSPIKAPCRAMLTAVRWMPGQAATSPAPVGQTEGTSAAVRGPSTVSRAVLSPAQLLQLRSRNLARYWHVPSLGREVQSAVSWSLHGRIKYQTLDAP